MKNIMISKVLMVLVIFIDFIIVTDADYYYYLIVNQELISAKIAVL